MHLLISSKYADLIKEFLKKKIEAERQKELDDIMQFAGIFDGETQNMLSKEIKALKKDRYIIKDGNRIDK